jgi:hypothetical protein
MRAKHPMTRILAGSQRGTEPLAALIGDHEDSTRVDESRQNTAKDDKLLSTS